MGMDSFQGFPQILSIFYAEFHPTQGPKVAFQVPENFITSAAAAGVGAFGGAASGNANSGPAGGGGVGGSGGEWPDEGARSSNDGGGMQSSTLSLLHSSSSPTLLTSPSPRSGDRSISPLRLASTTATAAQPGSANAGSHHPPPTLDFDSISEYIIPKPALCNRLVTLSTPYYQILSHPVSITNAKYERNALLFNLGFVFEKNAPTRVYQQIVRKLARIITGAEVQFGFLRNDSTKRGALGNIIEQIYDDLNSYAECQIPINESNMINLKLFPKYPNPPPVHDYQVPVLIVNLQRMMDKHWDMTMQRVIPRINGIHSVKRISENADVDCQLVRIAVQHLLYYGCVKLVDIFQFSNIYGIRPSLVRMLHDPAAQHECAQFVTRPLKPVPAFALLFSLYCALKPGTTVAEWMEDNNVGALNVDVRRFFMYGVIKEFVYRIHKYPFWIALQPSVPPAPPAIPTSQPKLHPHHHPSSSTGNLPSPGVPHDDAASTGSTLASQVSGYSHTTSHHTATSHQNTHPGMHTTNTGMNTTGVNTNRPLRKFLDGTRHYDELCTLFACSARELDEVLANGAPGEVVRFIWK